MPPIQQADRFLHDGRVTPSDLSDVDATPPHLGKAIPMERWIRDDSSVWWMRPPWEEVLQA
jgi:hypothetical protein